MKTLKVLGTVTGGTRAQFEYCQPLVSADVLGNGSQFCPDHVTKCKIVSTSGIGRDGQNILLTPTLCSPS